MTHDYVIVLTTLPTDADAAAFARGLDCGITRFGRGEALAGC